jgi:hypothetical protein
MGLTQTAVKAFLEAVRDDDDAMLDRWIPDEDWVRQIRNNSGRDCTVPNFNKGLSAVCIWQKNHAILEGTTIYFNTKKIKTSAIKKSIIRFYYVLSASAPVPTVPSDQAFYQALWDDPDRSNRSLKRTAPLVKNPQAKKSKTSDVASVVSSQPSRLLPPPPKLFEEANKMVLVAWKGAFPSLRFPVEMIALFPATKSLVAAPHERNQHQEL